MILIGMTGWAGSGKDTAADFLVERYGFIKTAFAKPIKEGCRAMFGLTDEHLYGALKEVVIEDYGCTPREIMQWAGTEFGRRMIHPDVWLMQVRKQWEDLNALDPQEHHCAGLIVSDVRFDNEADCIRKLGGTVIHVQRPRDQLSRDSQYLTHSSEQGVEPWPGDIAILNDGDLDRLRELTYMAYDEVVAVQT